MDSGEVTASIPWLEDNRLWLAAFSPDGRFLATADDRNVLLRNGSTYELIDTIPYSAVEPVLTFSPDGSVLAARGGANEIVLWSTETRQVLSRFTGARNLTFSPDGSLILVRRDTDMVLWGP
jgi:WD40 repeat protein